MDTSQIRLIQVNLNYCKAAIRENKPRRGRGQVFQQETHIYRYYIPPFDARGRAPQILAGHLNVLSPELTVER